MKTRPFRSLSEKKSEGDDDRPQFETGLKTRVDNGRLLEVLPDASEDQKAHLRAWLQEE